MDAIECGIVKIPRVPDRRQRHDRRLPEVPQPVGGHPRRAARTCAAARRTPTSPPLLPRTARRRAARASTATTRGKFAEWEADEEARANGSTPPVFIVVCNNTNVSKAVFDYVAGYETEHQHPDGEPVVAPGDAADCSAT